MIQISNILKKSNLLIILLFITSTFYFIRQHYLGISWDFISYLLNAKYIFDNGFYFEILRPPMASLLLWFSHLFTNWLIAEYIFIILVSVLFLYSSLKLSKALNFDPLIFYGLSLSFYILKFGIVNGTELLSISFLELSLVYLISNNPSSGIFLAFSALTRYTGLIFFPILLFQKKIKYIIISFILFCIPFIPWFIYNFYKTGNFFTSIADQYANNILFRNYIHQNVNVLDFISVFGFLIIFLMIGLIITFKNLINNYTKHKFNNIKNLILKNKINIIMISLFTYSISSYISIPIKHQRYLFTLSLPTIYFSYIGFIFILNKINLHIKKESNKIIVKNIIIIIIFLINIIFITQLEIHDYITYTDINTYKTGINDLKQLNISYTKSNAWIYLNYLNFNSTPYPREQLLSKDIKQGTNIIFFKHIKEPPYINNINSSTNLPIIKNNEKYIIIGKNTSNNTYIPKKYDLNYMNSVNQYINQTNNYTINTNPCFIIFHKIKIAEKFCNLINLKNFKIDKNRNLP